MTEETNPQSGEIPTNGSEKTEDQIVKELEALVLEEQKLAQKKQELFVLKAKVEQVAREKRQLELQANFSLIVTKLENGIVETESEYRHDVIEVMRNINGRYYKGGKVNTFPIEYWEEGAKKLAALPGVTIGYSDGTEAAITSELNKPNFEIQVSPDNKYLYIKVSRADAYPIKVIPGCKYNYQKEIYLIPITEGWRLYASLENVDKVQWNDYALKLVTSELEKRNTIDQVATKLDTDFIPPDFMPGITLRPFQKVGIEFAHVTNGKCLIADVMGLGKTIQGLGYAKLLRKDTGKLKVIVLCPARLKSNWAHEIKRFEDKEPIFLYGSEPSLYDMKRLLTMDDYYAIINYDIFGKNIEVWDTNPQGMKINIRKRWPWVELINLINPDLVLIDEAHYAKNVDSQRSQATRLISSNRVVALTGTPVMNRPGELWPILTLLAPEKFPSFEGFCYAYTYNNKEARNVEELRQLLKPLMIRRTKKQVQKELPPINRIYHWLELSESAKLMCGKIMEGMFEQLKIFDPDNAGNEMGVTSILAQIMRLKQVTSVDKIEAVSDLAVEIVDSLEDSTNKKLIIFTQFVPVAHEIAKRLGNEAVCFTGELNKSDRATVEREFKENNKIKFFVATDKMAQEGLNLQIAGAVLFVDYLWTPAAHEQCEGRAYGRLADEHSIDSYYVTAEESIDQWIQEILNRKMAVINQTVEGIDTERNSSMVMELIRKMKASMK